MRRRDFLSRFKALAVLPFVGRLFRRRPEPVDPEVAKKRLREHIAEHAKLREAVTARAVMMDTEHSAHADGKYRYFVDFYDDPEGGAE